MRQRLLEGNQGNSKIKFSMESKDTRFQVFGSFRKSQYKEIFQRFLLYIGATISLGVVAVIIYIAFWD